MVIIVFSLQNLRGKSKIILVYTQFKRIHFHEFFGVLSLEPWNIFLGGGLEGYAFWHFQNPQKFLGRLDSRISSSRVLPHKPSKGEKEQRVS
jgi:hypothetical protein